MILHLIITTNRFNKIHIASYNKLFSKQNNNIRQNV